jgi:hypothetical protein
LWGWCLALSAAAAIAGCDGTSAAVLRGAPKSYLLSIDQLVAPDFAVDVPPHVLAAGEIAATGSTLGQQVAAAGLVGAASEDFFRVSADLAVLNGPVQVTDTVEEFSSATGAATVYHASVTNLDAVSGSVPVSTGSLGDEAHATMRRAAAPGGVTAVEITVEWRVNNLLDILVVRGRYGGTRLDDALLLAHRQTVTELGLSTPTSRQSPSAS